MVSFVRLFNRLAENKHYNHKKYWRMRKEVINKDSKVPKMIRFYYLYRMKKIEALNNAFIGTFMGVGTTFLEPPILPHALNGIVISSFAKIGKNCTIYHQVTIAQENNKAAEIGDNCLIGAGAKIIGEIKIGNNVKIGANTVVNKDVPDNCTVVGIDKIVKLNGKRVNMSLKDYWNNNL